MTANEMTSNLQEWIAHPELLNRDTLYRLRTILAKYPYYQTARLLYLKNLYLLHDTDFGEELRKAAIQITDRRTLFYLIEGESLLARVAPKGLPETAEEPGLDRTLQLINAFLATVKEESMQPTDEASLSTDYMAYMLREESLPESDETTQSVPLRGQALIDNFIEKTEGKRPLPLGDAEEGEEPAAISGPNLLPDDDDDENYFTETLAKIYIKQQRYSKALEIIKKLSLKYPKKSTYFADQITQLENLIHNDNSK